MTDKDFQDKFLALKSGFKSKIQDKIDRIIEVQQELKQQNNNKAIEELHQLAHSLCGSSAMFGFNTISDISGELELLLKPIIKNSETYTQEVLDHINEITSRLKETYAGL